MDSYDILGVTREASNKEIEVAYSDLKNKYDPKYNTSVFAYKKYREILKAYEDIKDEQRRKMYDLKGNYSNEFVNHKEYVLYDFDRVNKQVDNKEIDYSKVEEVLVGDEYKDIEINIELSYLYKLLNLRYDLEYYHSVRCQNCSSFETCSVCEGKKVVEYENRIIWCPVCFGEGKVSQGCRSCGDKGFYKIKNSISIYVDNESYTFRGMGDEYSNELKSNLNVNFDFYDKDKIKIEDDVLLVDYYLSKEETIKGINKQFFSETGAFSLNVESFINDGEKKEIVFNNKKILFTFYNSEYDGNDVIKYLFIKPVFKGKYIYFSEDYASCSEQEDVFHPVMVKCEEKIVVNGKGEMGQYPGKNGHLIINVEFYKDDLLYVNDVKVLDTSKVFNLLGGFYQGFYHLGCKGRNALLKRNKSYYLLRGNNSKKLKLKNYFLFKCFSVVLWTLLPLLMFLIPYNEFTFIVMGIVLVAYNILINFLMEVEV